MRNLIRIKHNKGRFYDLHSSQRKANHQKPVLQESILPRFLVLASIFTPTLGILGLHISITNKTTLVVSLLVLLVCVLIALNTLMRAIRTRSEVLRNCKTDWLKLLRAKGHRFSKFYILLPLKNEYDITMLYNTLDAILNQNYPHKHIVLMPILEQEDMQTVEVIKQLELEFKERLQIKSFIYPTMGLIRSKATSLTKATEYIEKTLFRRNSKELPPKVLVIDADTKLHPQDLAFREFQHCYKTPGSVLQSLLINTINYWEASAAPRVQSLLWFVYQMGMMSSRGEYLVLGPGMSIPFETLKEVQYFKPLRHNEDMQFRHKVIMEGVNVAPLALPTWGMSAPNYKALWHQMSQWARSIADIEFILKYKPLCPQEGVATFRKKIVLITHVLRHSLSGYLILIPIYAVISLFYNAKVYNLLSVEIGLQLIVLIILAMTTLAGIMVTYLVNPFISGNGKIRNIKVVYDSLILLNIHNLIFILSAGVYTQFLYIIGCPMPSTQVTMKKAYINSRTSSSTSYTSTEKMIG